VTLADIISIVGGQSYGQGSSREHAALCPMFLGVKAVVAQSFERIHSANLINFGILPLTFQTESDYDLVDAGDELYIEAIRGAVEQNKPITIKNLSKGIDFKVCYDLTKRQRDIILAGGMLSYIKGR
jgi:aconitate hydratase